MERQTAARHPLFWHGLGVSLNSRHLNWELTQVQIDEQHTDETHLQRTTNAEHEYTGRHLEILHGRIAEFATPNLLIVSSSLLAKKKSETRVCNLQGTSRRSKVTLAEQCRITNVLKDPK
jgi:hypothetical protein